MSKQPNTKLIGGFVVGALALIVAGLLVFGSGRLFEKHTRRFVLFFSDSLSGLNVGAPVDFRGVRIGRVTDIKVVLDKKTLSPMIPVFIEIDPSKFFFAGNREELNNLMMANNNGMTYLQLLIKRGLRAQLSILSLITGQLGINLDFFPGTAVKLVNAEPGYQEIPTIESPISAIAKTMQKIPLSQISDKLLQTLDATQKVVGSPQLQSALVSLAQTLKQAHTLLVNLNNQVSPLAQDARSNLYQSRKMFTNAAKLTAKLNADIPQVVARLNETLKSAGLTIRGANNALDGFTSDDSPLRLQLLATLNELTSAARSFRILTEYLDAHPEAILRGKQK
ncbi:MAG: MlaD family protein [Deltaproteobacteria bacterium]|jgi:paraquat-inducible protein B|nr:MlaD family protein [Deltaproteobacteria bacterium]